MVARSVFSLALLALLLSCAPGLEAPPRGPCGAVGQRCCLPEEDGGAACAPGLVCEGSPFEFSTCASCPVGQSVCAGRCATTCQDGATDTSSDTFAVSDTASGEPLDASMDAAMCSPGLTFCSIAGCVNVQNNVDHCGMCDHPCNPGEVCRSGTCQCAVPEQSFCPGVGCTLLATDARNCGACGVSCLSGQTCEAGRCVCSVVGQTYCVGVGCVNLANDPSHCGACTTACREGLACVGGMCRCPSGLTLCDDSCVDLDASNLHCGACRNNCATAFPNAIAVCLAGRCVPVACMRDYADCGPEAGCEVHLGSDPSHCGACNMRCRMPNASVRCVDGVCRLGSCDEGFADCNGLSADGCEVNIRADPTNCGACGMRCNALPGRAVTCVSGVCMQSATCMIPLADCDGMASNGCEANLSTSILACGGCGRACNATNGIPTCSAGVCTSIVCNVGYGNCDNNLANGCEVDFASNSQHCGRCGNACAFANAAVTCRMGVCRLGTCVAGFGNCDGNEANGCETLLESNSAHCGVCGRACVGGASCVRGACTCPSGQIVCGTGTSAVCVDLLSNSAHCGACDRACPTGQRCVVGACVPSMMDAGTDAVADAPSDTTDRPDGTDASMDAFADRPDGTDASMDAFADRPDGTDAFMDASADRPDGTDGSIVDGG